MQLIALDQAPTIMGILNVNPDSFSDGGNYQDPEAALAHAREMLDHGAAIIDIGGESTRPGSRAISMEQEWSRISPVLDALATWRKKSCQTFWLSVDSYKAEIARRSLELGADIINDVSGGLCQPQILDWVAQSGAYYIAMHNPFALHPGLPANRPHARQESPYGKGSLDQIASELTQLYRQARHRGCKKILLDPGLGFGKSPECNREILALLPELRQKLPPEAPVLIGGSNKRFVRSLQENQENLARNRTRSKEPGKVADFSQFLTANLAVCAVAIQGGAQVIRSHEVQQHYLMAHGTWQLLQSRTPKRTTEGGYIG